MIKKLFQNCSLLKFKNWRGPELGQEQTNKGVYKINDLLLFYTDIEWLPIWKKIHDNKFDISKY